MKISRADTEPDAWRDGSVTHQLREVDPANQDDVAAITRLHLTLLGHGPMARLGELFLRRFCYTVLIKDGLLRAALYEVDGRPAGFIAYTTRSITFHRIAVRRHWVYVALLTIISVARDPRILLHLLKGIRLTLLPEYRSREFVRRTGRRISCELFARTREYFRREKIASFRLLVEADNREALLFYHAMGCSFRHAPNGEQTVELICAADH